MSWENAVLSSNLASPGYGCGEHGIWERPARVMTNDSKGRRAGEDISFLIGYARTLPDAELSEIAVAGFIGVDLDCLQQRGIRIDALVAWTGVCGTTRAGEGFGLCSSGGNDLAAVVFYSRCDFIRGAGEGLYKQGQRGPNVLNGWTHGDLLRWRYGPDACGAQLDVSAE